jgi:hypothetical protein
LLKFDKQNSSYEFLKFKQDSEIKIEKQIGLNLRLPRGGS